MNSVEYIVAAGIALAEKYEREIAELRAGVNANIATDVKTAFAQPDDLDVTIDALERLKQHLSRKGVMT